MKSSASGLLKRSSLSRRNQKMSCLLDGCKSYLGNAGSIIGATGSASITPRTHLSSLGLKSKGSVSNKADFMALESLMRRKGVGGNVLMDTTGAEANLVQKPGA